MVAQRLASIPEITSCKDYQGIKMQTCTVIDPKFIFDMKTNWIPNDNKDRHMTHSSDAENTFMLCNV